MLGFLLAAGGLFGTLVFDQMWLTILCLTIAIFGADGNRYPVPPTGNW